MKSSLALPLLLSCVAAMACNGNTSGHIADNAVVGVQQTTHPFAARMATVGPALAKLPPEVQPTVFSTIESEPELFFSLLDQVAQLWQHDPFLLRLVDKVRALPSDYVPQDLANLDGYALDLSKPGQQLRAVLMADLLAMTAAARNEGLSLLISSAYRSYTYQEKTYATWVRTLGQTEADRISARAGHSQHQLGTTLDFGSIDDSFTGTAAELWLRSRAGDFGFSLSYPQDKTAYTGYSGESWHYRYLGKAACALQQRFFLGTQQFMLVFFDSYFTSVSHP